MIERLVAPGLTGGDYFGAALALDGGTLLVGCHRGEQGDSGPDSGRAFIFTYDAADQAFGGAEELIRDVGDGTDDYFGRAVALSGDFALVGRVVPEPPACLVHFRLCEPSAEQAPRGAAPCGDLINPPPPPASTVPPHRWAPTTPTRRAQMPGRPTCFGAGTRGTGSSTPSSSRGTPKTSTTLVRSLFPPPPPPLLLPSPPASPGGPEPTYSFEENAAAAERWEVLDSESSSQVKVYSSRRQESHVQRRRVTGAWAGARGCGPHHPPVSRKSPARDESSFGCVVQTRQFLFVFSLRCVGFSRSSVLKFPFKGSW